MKPETLLDAMNFLDDDLIARAETPKTGKLRRFPRKLAAVAACLTLLLGATAFATGALDPLLSYFNDPSGTYTEDFLAAGATVANDAVELRLEGAIADSRNAYMVVSFIGLDETTTRDLKKDITAGRWGLDFTALTPDGETLAFPSSSMGTYTTGKSQPISHFEDAAVTYVFFGTLPKDLPMEDVAQICLTYGDLTLAVPVEDCLCPEYALEPEGEGLPEVSDFRMSAIGFSYSTTDLELYLDLKPIFADGTVYENFNEDYGSSAGGGWEEGADSATVTGHWCSGAPLALTVLNLDDYCGLQANGVNYYFVEE